MLKMRVGATFSATFTITSAVLFSASSDAAAAFEALLVD
jgi:hypothetical protein